MQFTLDNLNYCLAAPGNFYAQWRDELAATGFRTISLSVAGPVSSPMYTAIMVKFARPFRGRSDPSMTLSELKSKIADLANDAQPLHPYILSATGSGSSIMYGAAFRAMSEAPVVRPNLTAAQFTAENAVQREAGRMPIWLDSFGTSSDIRYCGIWSVNHNHIAWSADALNDRGDSRQQRFPDRDGAKGLGDAGQPEERGWLGVGVAWLGEAVAAREDQPRALHDRNGGTALCMRLDIRLHPLVQLGCLVGIRRIQGHAPHAALAKGPRNNLVALLENGRVAHRTIDDLGADADREPVELPLLLQ